MIIDKLIDVKDISRVVKNVKKVEVVLKWLQDRIKVWA